MFAEMLVAMAVGMGDAMLVATNVLMLPGMALAVVRLPLGRNVGRPAGQQ